MKTYGQENEISFSTRQQHDHCNIFFDKGKTLKKNKIGETFQAEVKVHE